MPEMPPSMKVVPFDDDQRLLLTALRDALAITSLQRDEAREEAASLREQLRDLTDQRDRLRAAAQALALTAIEFGHATRRQSGLADQVMQALERLSA